jgi:hypothetical protein
MELSQTQHITLFIDEFQDFYRVNPSIYSDMQNIWDTYKNTAHINLIVAGSVNTLMNKIFKDKKQPLFGRQTATMHVRPFRPSVLKEIMSEYCPDYKKADLLALYTLTGEELRRRGPEGQIRAVLQSCRSLQGIRYCIQRVIHRRHVVCEYQQSAPNIKNCHQRLNLRSLFVIYL